MLTALSATAIQQKMNAYATVLDLQPLFTLRDQWANAHANITSLNAQATNSRAQYERSRQLFNDDQNISQKSVQDAQTLMQNDIAKLDAARAMLPRLAATIQQQFGESIAHNVLLPKSDLLQSLQSGQASILRVTLPNTYAAVAPNNVTVQSAQEQALTAQKLSSSPQADPSLQGSPWLYLVPHALPMGSRLTVQLPIPNQTLSGILIPESAVIWYGGQTWAYVRTAPNQFTRRFVPAHNETGQGFIADHSFRAGDVVVTQGAQLLLSEELKPQGISTICKDPPECDD
ncbi:MAG: efflux RND transporter periplasmic adaptor subunit [Acinetobacter sp.]|nr:efflux RND transporter periplasmic adaptor subunit [Acinetobacter sp.]